MVLKIWLAIGLALTVAAIIIFMGMMNQARFTVILYRTIISIGIFASCGYIIGLVFETRFLPYAKKLLETDVNNLADHSDENAMKISNEEEATIGETDLLAEEQKEADFAPFTTDNLKHVVSPPNS